MRSPSPDTSPGQDRAIRRGRSVLAFVVTATLVVGCDAGPTSESPSVSAPSIRTSDGPTAVPRLLVHEVADARRFREDYGLRADDEWIRDVAADPTSDRTSFGVPLTTGEVAELNRRTAAADEIKNLVVDYALAHADEYAGAYTDQQRGGIFVAQFSGHVAEHKAALFARVRPGAPLEVREVRWSLEQLEAFASRLQGAGGWFRTIPAYLTGYGPNVPTNRVNVQISSVDPDAAAKIEAHFRWTNEIVEVETDGTGALLLPTGTLRIVARDSGGVPVPGLACVAIPDLDGAYEPRPIPMPTTDEIGRCVLRLPATGYWIRLEVGEAPPELVAIGRAVVVADATMGVVIGTP